MPRLSGPFELSDDDYITGSTTSFEDGIGGESTDTDGDYPTAFPTAEALMLSDNSDTEDKEPISNLLPSLRKQKVSESDEIAKSTAARLEGAFLQNHYQSLSRSSGRKYCYRIRIDDFKVYQRGCSPNLPQSLHSIAASKCKNRFPYMCAGTLVHENGSKLKMQVIEIIGIKFGTLCQLTENLRPESVSCRKHISIQSPISQKFDVWYHLGTPSPLYQHCFQAFTWLADFTKHVSDYVSWAAAIGRDVKLWDMKSHFVEKLFEWHKDSPGFERWHNECGNTIDFRRHLLASSHTDFIYDHIRTATEDPETHILSHSIWGEINKRSKPKRCNQHVKNQKTLVTAHAQRCFIRQFPSWGNKTPLAYDLLQVIEPKQEVIEEQIRRQKALSIGVKIKYRKKNHFERCDNKTYSYASLLLENAAHPANRAPIVPLDSELLGKAVIIRVPHSFPTEYRFAWVHSIIHGKLKIRWLALPHQTLCRGRRSNSSLQRTSSYYPIGNELFLTSDCSCGDVPIRNVVAVHSVTMQSDHACEGTELFVSHIYNACDDSMSIVDDCHLSECQTHPRKQPKTASSLHQKELNELSMEQIKALSLFSGGGIFDFGVEVGSGGLFETVFAADKDYAAILSYKANHPNPEKCRLERGDVNVLLQKIVDGVLSLPAIDLFIAGTPCPGFSGLNNRREDEKGQKNCSLLAHALSWIEILVPKMILLENVPEMDPSNQAKASAAGQTVSYLVSLGYQVKLVTIKASNVGAATTRERLFVIASAPGIPLPAVVSTDGFGSSPVVTTKDASINLDTIKNETMLNPKFPDHVPFDQLSDMLCTIISRIPKTIPPKGKMHGLSPDLFVSQAEREWYSCLNESQRGPQSKSYTRTHPHKPYQTIVATMSPHCSRMGTTIHWDQDRLLSLEEFRRFHGVPEAYLLVGSKADQIRQLGNSVSFPVAVLLGKALAVSWRQSRYSATGSNIGGSGSTIHNLSDIEEEIYDDLSEQQSSSELMAMYGLRASLPPNSSRERGMSHHVQENAAQQWNKLAELKALVTSDHLHDQAIDTGSEELLDLHELFKTSKKSQRSSLKLSQSTSHSSTRSMPSSTLFRPTPLTEITESVTSSTFIRKRPLDFNCDDDNGGEDSDNSPSKRARHIPVSKASVVGMRRRMLPFHASTVPVRVFTKGDKQSWSIFEQDADGSSTETAILLDDDDDEGK